MATTRSFSTIRSQVRRVRLWVLSAMALGLAIALATAPLARAQTPDGFVNRL